MKHKNRKGNFCIIIGLLLIAAALSLTIYNKWDEKRAGETAQLTLQQLQAVQNEQAQVSGELSEGDVLTPDGSIIPEYLLNPGKDMPIVEIDGNGYIGVLSLPTLGLALPVMDDWSYERLRTSPCRYAGSAYTNDLIICAHNYEEHFGRIDELQLGDEVRFTDTEGHEFVYVVVEMELLGPTAIDAMKSGQWDLTLYTCTLGGQQRVTIRCEQQLYN